MVYILYLYISISRETQDAKGREALIWILPHHTYVAKVNTSILCEPRFLHLRNQPDTGVEQWIARMVDRLANHSATRLTSEAVKVETGKLLKEPEEIRNRWKEYIETLYDKNGKP